MNIFQAIWYRISAEWTMHQLRGDQAREYRAVKKARRAAGKGDQSYTGYTPDATWLRRVLYNKFGWSITSQNENRDRGGHYGSKFWHGRAWLGRWDNKTDSAGFDLRVTWEFGKRAHTRLMFTRGGGDSGKDVRLAVGVFHLFTFWFTLEDVIKKGYGKYNEHDKDWGFSIWEGHISLSWGYIDSGAWYSDKAKNKRENPGFHVFFDWRDKLLGKAAHDRAFVSEERTVIPMPEKAYPATVKIERASWKRPRWPFTQVIYSATITPDEGIGIPGKGENGWDLDEDATFQSSAPARTTEEAVAHFVQSTLEVRRHRGGKDWTPEKVHPQFIES